MPTGISDVSPLACSSGVSFTPSRASTRALGSVEETSRVTDRRVFVLGSCRYTGTIVAVGMIGSGGFAVVVGDSRAVASPAASNRGVESLGTPHAANPHSSTTATAAARRPWRGGVTARSRAAR